MLIWIIPSIWFFSFMLCMWLERTELSYIHDHNGHIMLALFVISGFILAPILLGQLLTHRLFTHLRVTNNKVPNQ